MIHQPWGGYKGVASDIEIHARETAEIRKRLDEILARHTGQTEDTIHVDTERDNFLNAEEAVNYGLVDSVLAPRQKTRQT